MEIQQPGDSLDPSEYVSSLSGLTGDVVLVAGAGITVTPLGQNITIASTADLSVTLADVSTNSTTATPSIYTMTSTIPVDFKTSGGTHLWYLDETNGMIGVGTTSPSSYTGGLTGRFQVIRGGGLSFSDTGGASDYYVFYSSGTTLKLYNASGNRTWSFTQTGYLVVPIQVAIGTSGGLSNSSLYIPVAPSATASTANVALGGGGWSGSATHFAGSASGTSYGLNELSTFAGNLIDLQRAGVSRFKTSGVGAMFLGAATAGGNSQLVNIGHNGTTTSSADGIVQLKFNSQFDNYPFSMGTRGNGYTFTIFQTNGGQGTFEWDFGTISTVAYKLNLTYSTDHYEQIYTGKWLSTFSGAGASGNFYGFYNTITSNSTSALFDTFRISKAINTGNWQTSNDPILSLFNGDTTGAITGTNKYVARFTRWGYLGIGTASGYGTPETKIQGALTVNQGTTTGFITSDGVTSAHLKTTGSSTSVISPDNNNSAIPMGLIVGSQITANGVVRTITSITNAQDFVVDTAVDWSNGGTGYTFTYRNPYISLRDGSTTMFVVDPNGLTGIGVALPLSILHLKAGTATANTAPLQFSSGTIETTARAGTHEYNGSHYLTKASALRLGLGGCIFDYYTDVGNVGTGEDDLYSSTLPASTLATNGEKVTATYQGIFVGAAASTQELRLYFGGTKIYDSGALSIGVATDNWTVHVTLIRVSSSVVRCSVSLSTDFGTLFPYSTYTEVTGLTLTNTQILKITGEAAGVGAVDNQIVAKLGTVSWLASAAL